MPKKTDPSTIEISLPGLNQHSGYLAEEKHTRLQGIAAARTFEEMSQNDAVVGSCLYAIESFLKSLDWKVRPANESAEAVAEAEFLTQCRDDMDQAWADLISDILSMLVYGFSLHEIVYKVRRGPDSASPRFRSKYSDGRFGWRAIACRAQTTIERWEIDDKTGEIYGAYQRPPPAYDTTYLPMSRCVLFRTKTYKNNPEGVSVLRRAYRSWYFKKRLEEIEAVGISRDLNGIPIIEVPAAVMSPSATAAQRAVRTQMQTMVSLISRDQFEGLVFPAELDSDNKPTGYKFRLASSSGQKAIPADGVIRRYDARIAMTLAAEFLLLGTEKTGSFALAAEKSSHFARTLTWYARGIQDQLNTVCVPRLMTVNGVAPENWPRFEHGPIALPDLMALGLFLQQVTTAQLLTPTPQLEKYIREIAQAPAPTTEEEAAIADRLETLAEKQAMEAEPPPAPVVTPPGEGDEDAPEEEEE